VNPYSKHEARVQPLRERQRQETARAIVEAAEEVFARRGTGEGRIEEIAQRAGVSVGTVYNHFEDRDALLRELVVRRKQELIRELDAALGQARGEPFRRQLQGFARTLFEHFEAHREFLAISFQSEARSIERPTETMREMMARVEALVRRGVEQKALRKLGHELWPMMLLSAVRAVLVHELRHPGRLEIGERIDAVVDFFLGGAGA
jgi:AcrR family transcriptional regulator